MDALSPSDRMTLEISRSLREDFLQQDALGDNDSYTPLEKQHDLLALIFSFEDKGREAISRGADIAAISELPVRESIGRAKAVPYENYKAEYAEISAELDRELEALIPGSRPAERGQR